MFYRTIIGIISFFAFTLAQAQDGSTVFNFLRLPYSAHATALGGENISIIEDDLTMALHNPALLSYVSDKTLNLNYMTYFEGTKTASAAFARLFGARSSWAAAVQYVDYGSSDERNEEGSVLGYYSAKDILMSAIYTYDLSDSWSGGVKTNFIYSTYGKYNSFGIGVDLGLNYYKEENGLSLSLTARNLGGQIVAFDETHEKLPFDLQAGISKMLAHAPFRFSATLYQLTRWRNKTDKNIANHLVIGADYIPTNNFYVSLGYNFRRAKEMKIADSSHWAGLTFGAGIHIKRIKLGVAYAKYHTTTSSLLFNLAIML